MSFPAFGSLACASVLVKSDAGITAVLPSGVVTVAFPFSSKTTFVGCSVSLSGFTALILAIISAFSASVNASGFATIVLSAGVLASFPPLSFAPSSEIVSLVVPASVTAPVSGFTL